MITANAELGRTISEQAIVHGDAARGAGREAVSECLARMAAGNRQGLSDLFGLTNAKVYGLCLHILKDPTIAEDVMQETYLTIWNKAHMFEKDRASPITWICTIARNKCIDQLRRKRGRSDADLDEALDLADLAPSPEAVADLSGQAKRLADCMGELPSDLSGTIRQAFWQGTTYAELAEAQNMPVSSMKSRIRRSLISLRSCLEVTT